MEKKNGIDSEEYAKKFPVVRYDVQPNANGNTYEQNELTKMVDQWSSQKSLGVFQPNLALSELTEEMSIKAVKDMEQKMYESIVSGAGLSASTFPSSQYFNVEDYNKAVESILKGDKNAMNPDMDKKRFINEVIDSISTDDLISRTLTKMGRNATAQSISAAKEYMIRITKSPLFDKDQPGPPGKESEFTKPLFQELLDIEGVDKAEVMLDDYPETVSIIIRINMSDFPDDLVDVNMEKIDYAIQKNKPQYLEKLEVLFHNKVVY